MITDTQDNIEILPNVVYYNDDHSNTPTCTVEIGSVLKLTFSAPSTWHELIAELEAGAKYLAFHADMIERSTYSTPRDFVDAIRTICRFIPASRDISIVVVVKPTTPLTIIHALQKAGCQGLVLDLNYWTAEQAAAGGNALLNNIPYWPKHILDQLPNPVKKPVMIYFRSPSDDDVTKGESTVVEDYNNVLPVRVVTCDGWNQLDQLLLDHPDQISINSNVFTSTDAATIKETVGMLQTRLKLAGVNAPITLVVENDTLRHVVLEAKQLGLQGLIPYHGDWDPADIMAGLQAMTDRVLHWPEHIINKLPDDLPVSVYFRVDAPTYVSEDMVQQLKKNALCRVQFCANWDELSDALRNQPHQLVFHISMLTRLDLSISEIIESLLTKMKLFGVEVPLGVGIDADTPLAVIKELKRAGIFGIVPSAGDFGPHETVAGLNAMARREPYWPKHLLDQLPGAKKKIKNEDSIVLTERQGQVFKHITQRGASNKVIAKSLGISESTVKLHVSEIFKKYGVRTRTQLAVFSSA